MTAYRLVRLFGDVPAATPSWAIAVSIGLPVVFVTAPLMILNILGDRRGKRLFDERATKSGLDVESSDIKYGWARGPFKLRWRWTTAFSAAHSRALLSGSFGSAASTEAAPFVSA